MRNPNEPPARHEDAQPSRPRRLWDEKRQCWVEAHTFCRDRAGRWACKNGGEPRSELSLFGNGPAKAA